MATRGSLHSSHKAPAPQKSKTKAGKWCGKENNWCVTSTRNSLVLLENSPAAPETRRSQAQGRSQPVKQKNSEVTLPPDGHRQKHSSWEQHLGRHIPLCYQQQFWWRTEHKKVRSTAKCINCPFKTRELTESAERILESQQQELARLLRDGMRVVGTQTQIFKYFSHFQGPEMHPSFSEPFF